MIPSSIVRYLEGHSIPYEVLRHPRAIGASELAQAMHVTGHIVAKTVVVEVDGSKWIAMIPANEVVDGARLASALSATRVSLVREEELANLFPECEVGAAPPFGGLYRLPVVADSSFDAHTIIWMRGGTHEESLGMHWVDYLDLEGPRLAPIGSMREWGAAELPR